MKYTVQIPMILTLEVEAPDAEEAVYEAREIWSNGIIEMDQPFDLNERWESSEVFDEDGNYVEETA